LAVGLNLNNHHQTRTTRKKTNESVIFAFLRFVFVFSLREWTEISILFSREKNGSVRLLFICFSLPLSRTNDTKFLPNLRVNDLARARVRATAKYKNEKARTVGTFFFFVHKQ